jgi:hypothetical protein
MVGVNVFVGLDVAVRVGVSVAGGVSVKGWVVAVTVTAGDVGVACSSADGAQAATNRKIKNMIL